jgi:hypothetical protein
MKTNSEFRAALNMVLSRVDGDAKRASSEDWAAIESALSDAAAYAGKARRLRQRLEAKGESADLEKAREGSQ